MLDQVNGTLQSLGNGRGFGQNAGPTFSPVDTPGRLVGERSTYDGAILALETLASSLRKELEPVPGKQGAFQLVGFQMRGTRPVRIVQVMRVEPCGAGWRVLAWRETEEAL